MRTVLAIAAAGEIATGVILLVYPPVAVRLLFGAEIVGVGIAVSRIAGMGLLALGLACWPGRDAADHRAAFRGMSTYTVLVALYLIHVGTRRPDTGILLWPAVAAHLALAVLLAWTRRTSPSPVRSEGER
ncbi:MAG TPA: hypothetical protein VEL75_14770 [Candidatus Methylomirabilis sp.]|nr:hypothetical protein [Candidatus Methylomirabilis sp.]